MALLKVNPQAESKSDFPTFAPGTYRMRIKAVEDRSMNAENPKQDYKLTLEFVDLAQLVKIDGTPYNGGLDGAGNLFDYIPQKFEMQWKLCQLWESAGLIWPRDKGEQAEINSDDLLGKEIDVKVKTEVYEGEQKNKVGRYVLPK